MIEKPLRLCLNIPKEDPHSPCLLEDLNEFVKELRYTSRRATTTTPHGQHTLSKENEDVLLYKEKRLGT